MRQVAFASSPFLNSFLTQVHSLGVSVIPVIVIDAETCHPGPVRALMEGLVGYIERELTGEFTSDLQEKRVHGLDP